MSDVRSTPIVVVSGPPASGKTTVADAVAGELGLPLIAKDRLKETLYDSLGTGDVAWSQRLGRAAMALLYASLESQLSARRAVVVEANFAASQARAALLRLRARLPFVPLEIHCTAAPDVLVARYVERAGTRHVGHLDEFRVDEIRAAILDGRNGPLELGDDVIVVDTTDPGAVDLDSLIAAARTHLELA